VISSFLNAWLPNVHENDFLVLNSSWCLGSPIYGRGCDSIRITFVLAVKANGINSSWCLGSPIYGRGFDSIRITFALAVQANGAKVTTLIFSKGKESGIEKNHDVLLSTKPKLG